MTSSPVGSLVHVVLLWSFSSFLCVSAVTSLFPLPLLIPPPLSLSLSPSFPVPSLSFSPSPSPFPLSLLPSFPLPSLFLPLLPPPSPLSFSLSLLPPPLSLFLSPSSPLPSLFPSQGNVILTDCTYSILNLLRTRKDADAEVRFAVREIFSRDAVKKEQPLPTRDQ